MGRRGPQPKPTALRVLHGDRKDRINADEPQPATVEGAEAPAWLSAQARQTWAEVTPELIATHVLTVVDLPAWALACAAEGTARVLAELTGKSPPLTKNRDDYLVKNLVYGMSRAHGTEARLWMREFGMTPASRAALKVDVAHVDRSERYLTG